MADRLSNQPRSPRLRLRLRTSFWRKIKEIFTTRSLPSINCTAIRVLLDTPSTPTPNEDESPISPVSPVSPVFSDTPHTTPINGSKGRKSPPVERAWYTDASLSSSFARKERSVRESTFSSRQSSLDTVRGRDPHYPPSTLRAISTPYLFPFPSTEATTRPRCSTGGIWERVAEVGMQEEDHPS